MPRGTVEKARLVEVIREVLETRAEIVFAYLHGSIESRGPFRDIDVAVWVNATRPPDSGMDPYAMDLAAALQASVKAPVDVQVLNRAPLAFRYHALRGTPILVRDWNFLDELRARTWDEYFDFLPLARHYLREALSA